MRLSKVNCLALLKQSHNLLMNNKKYQFLMVKLLKLRLSTHNKKVSLYFPTKKICGFVKDLEITITLLAKLISIKMFNIFGFINPRV